MNGKYNIDFGVCFTSRIFFAFYYLIHSNINNFLDVIKMTSAAAFCFVTFFWDAGSPIQA